jgi:polyisoprenoid-binding protein YceI
MKTRTKILIGALVVILAAAGGGAYLFFKDDAPPKASVDAAAKGVVTTTTEKGSTASTATTASGIEGAWSVEKSTGNFSYSDEDTGTFVGFRIAENLAGIGSTTAVGRTHDVTGTMAIAGTTVSDATFDVDLTTITTDREQRNQRVQQALDTNQFPKATFKLTTPIDLGADAASGKEVDVNATGDLTLHGVTKSVTFPLQAKLVSGTVVVAGSIDIKFSDYGVQVPQSQIVLSVADHGTLELQMHLKKA